MIEENITKTAESNLLTMRLVGELLKQKDDKPIFNFVIPDYQRGYRWDDVQVIDLLEDLYEFQSSENSGNYCLQPIVVRKNKEEKYEVLDGQQRLTTIFLLLTCLKKEILLIPLYTIEYKTRTDSEDFLQYQLNGTIVSSCPDFFYMSTAYKTIIDWLNAKRKDEIDISNQLLTTLVRRTEFIWYEINEDQDPIDVFTRINIGKIPLTNAELVKAVFLSRSNLMLGSNEDQSNNRLIEIRQNSIALQWDLIEKSLQNPDFWAFVYPGKKEYTTRIDYLLDVISSNCNEDNEKNKYASFSYFYNKVKSFKKEKSTVNDSVSFIEREWLAFKNLFDTLVEWYETKENNHLIGFLIKNGESIIKLREKYLSSSRSSFKQNVSNLIKSYVNSKELNELRYKKHNVMIHNVLMLHNLLKNLHNEDSNKYFPFHKYSNADWTLEHIYAQNSEEIKEKDYAEFIADHYEYFISANSSEFDKLIGICNKLFEELNLGNLSEKEIINKLRKDGLTIDRERFNNFANEIKINIDNLNEQNVADNDDWISEDDSIANLALLDNRVNSSIKNSLFDIKRSKILEKDKKGHFIPIETKNVFLKYYTESPKHLAYWTYEDRKAYVADIKQTLKQLN